MRNKLLALLKMQKLQEDSRYTMLRRKYENGDIVFYGNAGLKMTGRHINSKEFHDNIKNAGQKIKSK